MQERELNFKGEKFHQSLEQQVVWYYLHYGSVNAVLQKAEIPLSEAAIHRIIRDYDIVKYSGRHDTPFDELLTFLHEFSIERRGVEKVAHSQLPLRRRTSDTTFYRIAKNTLSGTIRRYAAAVVLTPENVNKYVLIADDCSGIDRGENECVITIPSGFVDNKLDDKTIVKGIVQREVLANLVLARKFPPDLCMNAYHFMDLVLGDVLVHAYHLSVPYSYLTISSLSSPKIINHRFTTPEKVISGGFPNLRLGAYEVAKGYENYLRGVSFTRMTADVNKQIINRGKSVVDSLYH